MKRIPETIPALLAKLIAIPSPYFREHQVAEFVYQVMQHNGITTLRQKVADPTLQDYEGENIVGVLDAGKDTTILLNAHMDTVYPTQDWKSDPHQAHTMDGEMVGLGAADMKGGLAAMLMAQKEMMRRIRQGETPAHNVVYLASVDEEGPDSLGARRFLKDALARRIDYCLVLESGQGLSRGEAGFPTLIHGSLGCYLYRITVTGQSAHAADPEAGANAIDAMSHVLTALKEVPLEKAPGFSRPVCNTLWTQGGAKALSTPEKCEILVDFHVTPAEDSRKLKAKIKHQLQSFQSRRYPDCHSGSGWRQPACGGRTRQSQTAGYSCGDSG